MTLERIAFKAPERVLSSYCYCGILDPRNIMSVPVVGKEGLGSIT